MVKLFKNNIWILILIASIVLIPMSLTTQTEINVRVLITGIAVDLTEDERYEVTAQVLFPGQTDSGSQAAIHFVTVTEENISTAIEVIAIRIGRIPGLSHLSFILLGQDVYEKLNMYNVLDHFIRDERIPNSTSFYCTEGKAKDQMYMTSSLQLTSAISIQKIFMSKEQVMDGIMVPVQAFLDHGLEGSCGHLVSGFEITKQKVLEEEEENSEPVEDDNSGRIMDKSDVYLFRKGKFVKKIVDYDAKMGIFLLDRKSEEGLFVVNGVNGDIYKNASITAFLRDKSLKIRARFEDGVPHIKFSLKFSNNKIMGIENENIGNDNYSTKKNFINEPVKKALSEKLEKCILSAISELEGIDVYEFEEKFYRFHPREYKKQKKLYGDSFFENIVFEFDIKISDKK